MVAVAQLVEPLVVVQVVAGSSPVSHPHQKASAVKADSVNRICLYVSGRAESFSSYGGIDCSISLALPQ